MAGLWPIYLLLVPHEKHVIHKCHCKEVNYELPVECDLSGSRTEGDGEGRPWHLLKH